MVETVLVNVCVHLNSEVKEPAILWGWCGPWWVIPLWSGWGVSWVGHSDKQHGSMALEPAKQAHTDGVTDSGATPTFHS